MMYLIRNSSKIAKIKIKINNKIRIEEYLGDGCLISTPAGSSAYNLSLRGPVIPVGAKVLALTPISPYRPRRWRGALLNNDAKITLMQKILTYGQLEPKQISCNSKIFIN